MVAHAQPSRATLRPSDAASALLPVLRWRSNHAWLGGLVVLAWPAGLVQHLILRGGSGVGKVWLLDAAHEQGLLTWISVLTLVTAARLLFRQAQDAVAEGQRCILPWLLLGAVFTVLSLDEFLRLHDRRGEDAFLHRRLVSAEEGRELLGFFMVIHALLDLRGRGLAGGTARSPAVA